MPSPKVTVLLFQIYRKVYSLYFCNRFFPGSLHEILKKKKKTEDWLLHSAKVIVLLLRPAAKALSAAMV